MNRASHQRIGDRVAVRDYDAARIGSVRLGTVTATDTIGRCMVRYDHTGIAAPPPPQMVPPSMLLDEDQALAALGDWRTWVVSQ